MGKLINAGACVLLAGLTACSTVSTRNDLGSSLPDYFRRRESLDAHGRVTVLLGMWHHAAATGDFEAYFRSMTDDAVFLGTDPGERWTRAEFEAFSRPHFDGVEAWTYEEVERNVTVGPDGSGGRPEIVWFDEVLWNKKYGLCRGTGVARRSLDDPKAGFGGWQIASYSLTLLVPNESTGAVMEAIGPQPRPDDLDR